MEGLAITPDGKTLVGIMQAPLEQDTNKWLRIVAVDIASGATKEFAYKLTTGTGVSDIVAINSHEFLVDERDGKGLGDGSNAAVKQLFKIDIDGATDVSGIDDNLNNHTANFTAVAKSASPVLDLVSALGANGVPPSQIQAKIEGTAFGGDVLVNGVLEHTLWIANDNDFLATAIPNGSTRPIDKPNRFYVFAFNDSDLGVGTLFEKQQIPLPGTAWLIASGWLTWMGSRKNSKA